MMIIEYPLISVLILTYNHEKYINDCIESVVRQSYPRIELIMIDDASTDGTIKKIESKREIIDNRVDRFVQIINQTNEGNISRNINRMLKEAQGDYIKVFSGDDMMKPELLLTLYEDIKVTGCTVAYCNQYEVPDDYTLSNDKDSNLKKSINNRRSEIEDRLFFNRLIYGNCIPAPTVLYSAGVFSRNGVFDEELEFEDYEFNLRVSRTEKYYYDDKCLVYYRKSNDSVSNYNAGKKEKKLLFMIKGDQHSIEKHINEVSIDEQKARWEKTVVWYYQQCKNIGSEEGKRYLKDLAEEKGIDIDFNYLDSCDTAAELEKTWEEKQLDSLYFENKLKERGVDSFALYGYGDLGKKLFELLQTEKTYVNFIIDKRAHTANFPIDAFSLDEHLPKTDCVIVTPVGISGDIIKVIEGKTGAIVLRLSDIIKEA